MTMVTASIEIDAPRERVYDLALDPSRLDEWVTIHRRVNARDAGPPREGFEMDQTLHLRGVHFKVRWKLEEVRAPRYARWVGIGPARSTATTEYRLSEHDGHTRFDYCNEFRTPFGPLGAAASKVIVGGIPEKEANASLRRLKEILENRR